MNSIEAKPVSLLDGSVPRLRQCENCGQNVVRVIPELDVANGKETAHQQAGASQQRQRERDLTHHQQVPQPAVAAALAGSAPTGSQIALKVSPDRLQRRRQTEQQRADERDDDSEQQDRTVDANVRFSRNVPGRDYGDHDF